MKKIVFVINYFHPDYASTGQLMTELCQSLSADFEITVIAAQPGYSANFQKRYSKLIEVEDWEKIKVVRVSLPKVNKNSKFSRLKYILQYFLLANFVLLREKNIDLIYTISQPPILGGLIGTIGKIFKNTKHVYNIQDFNPEQAAAVNYTGGAIHNIAKKIDKLNCNYADHIILVGNDMKETLNNRFGQKPPPAHTVINNWTNEQEIIPLDKSNAEVDRFIKQHSLENKFIIMYSGNLGLYYDLENLIRITSEFNSNDRLHFLFIGEGASKSTMENYVVDNNIDNVTFLPYQPKEFIKYSLNAADAHLVVNQKGIKGVSVPSKIYGVMAAGKPILGVLEEGSEADTLIRASESGFVSEPQDYNLLIDHIKLLVEMDVESRKEMGLRGRKYLESNLTKDKSLVKYKDLLQRLTE
ncbi:glycosyltransferase family 4 protein [Exiguobacterium chiriqhucha]|uniref:glycosyltransferase family 4 protein n=1 Tax=Exiguobacterium chiriqhucha TaxID=1385984 RepID=UPI00049822E7|nr:glycosyltransferase family 4 protein [Exiguobacterium chiriqhucha]